MEFRFSVDRFMVDTHPHSNKKLSKRANFGDLEAWVFRRSWLLRVLRLSIIGGFNTTHSFSLFHR